MQRLQAYKFELKPNGEQQRNMRRFAGSCRFVFNRALAMQKAKYEHGEKRMSYAELCRALTDWKAQEETSWLADAPSQPLQQTLKNLDLAYANFFAKRADIPCFKRKGQSHGFRYPQGFKIDQDGSRIFLPKLGWIRYRNSREILGAAKNITVSIRDGKWFASIQTSREVEQPTHPSTSMVGIDVGISRFATMSDGSFISPLNSFRRHEQRLARYQRAMSRKTKFSNNWKKAKAKVQNIHASIANVRRDFLHKASSMISKNHAIVCIEDLQVRNMSKSSAGNSEFPGKKVRSKSGLNKSILDQGWGEFRRQLEYKQAWLGGEVLAVPPRNTSRTCPCCGHIAEENRQTQSRFACVDCGYENNADIVGAINILRAGHARIACQASDESMSPATGTHRSDLQGNRLFSAVGVLRHSAQEEANAEMLQVIRACVRCSAATGSCRPECSSAARNRPWLSSSALRGWR